MTDNNNGFQYTYSAREQEEIKSIREKYSPTRKAEGKADGGMEQLRRLDRAVTSRAQAVSLTLGIVGTLIMGFGMSLCMSELYELLSLGHTVAMITGVATGALGIALVALAYPVYNLTLEHLRKKAAPEILRLTDELMK